MIKSIFSAMAALGLSCGAVAHAGGLPLYHGEPADDQSYNRVVTIKPDAKWVNVTSGETVKFVDAATGRGFVWNFDTPGFEAFDLAAVAPRGVLSKEHVTVYVAQNPSDND